VNSKEKIKELISFGVDFIMTDHPDVYRSVLEEGI
jgi:glycerophosphoryl diester phosphodiesterase